MKIYRYISALLVCILFSASINAVQIRREPGHRIPEQILPTEHDDPSLWTTTKPGLTLYAAAPGAYSTNRIPRTGTIEYPLVLVDFSDLHFTIQDKQALRDHYERVFNEHGYSDTTVITFRGYTIYGATGSVSDYFRDQSYRQYTPKFKIIGPITLPEKYSFYGKGEWDPNVKILVRQICDSIITGGLADLAGYARNRSIDQLSIIYAGRGANYNGADINTIWPQASKMYFNKNSDPLIYNSGIDEIKYACTCELFWDSDSIMDGIGLFCHEFSHTLGLQDFYNTDLNAGNDDIDNAAMGYWSLMDYGCYENQGFSPVGYTAFEKYSLGWMDLEEITYAGTYVLNNISRKPDPESDIHSAYRLNTGNDDQFIVLENHPKTGWYKYHKAQGLMVTTVDYYDSIWQDNIINNYNPKHYRILPADNNYYRESNAGDLFPYAYTDSTGTHVIDSITTRGKPQLKAGKSYPPFSIYNIKLEDGLVTFHAGYDMPSSVETPRSTQIAIEISNGELSVSAPTGSTVTIYDISGKPISRTTTSAPVQQIPLPGHGIWIIKCGDITRKVTQ